jgi:hypothetical protein
VASTVSDPSSALGASLDSLALLETTTDQVTLLGVSLNQDVAADGSLDDVVEVYWSIPSRPGSFTTSVPFAANWQAIAFYWIGVEQAIVNGIYDGLASKADLPAGPVGTPVPRPGTPF